MATIRTNMVPLAVNGDGARGYLAQPDDDQPHPGIVLIQEWWGVEPHVIELAQRLAVAGFVTLVPDLYHGKVATEPDDARREVMMLMETVQNAMKEIRGALTYLAGLPEVEPKKLGIMGFCMGGRLTYFAAERFPEVGVAVPFYAGRYDPKPEDIANVTAPILAFYGGMDEGIPVEQIRKIESLYPAGHAFINPDHGDYHAASAHQAWDEAVAFLKQNLQ
jgi:carboxymethylenebutenolidase